LHNLLFTAGYYLCGGRKNPIFTATSLRKEVIYVKKPFNSLLFGIISAIVTLLIVVSAVAFWQKERTMPQVQTISPSPSQTYPEPIPRPVSNPAPPFQPFSIPPLATWKTYRNEEFGMEIKYPGFLHVDDEGLKRDDHSFVSATLVQLVGPTVPQGVPLTPLYVIISVERNTESLSNEQWIQSMKAFEAILFQKTTINNVQAVKVITKDEEYGTQGVGYTLFPNPKKNEFIYDIDFDEGSGSGLVSDPLKLFELMVKTVKFVH